MQSLIGLAAQIVAAQASSTAMSTEELVSSLTRIHCTIGQLAHRMIQPSLSQLETSTSLPLVAPSVAAGQPETRALPEAVPEAAAEEPKLTVKDSFRENEIVCMICGKNFRVLSNHLVLKHGMKPAAYRKRYGIPARQSLCAQVTYERAKKNGMRLAAARKGSESERAQVVAQVVAEVKRRPGRPKGSKSGNRSDQNAAAKVPRAPKAGAVKIAAASQPAV